MEAEQREELRRLAGDASDRDWTAGEEDGEYLVLQGCYIVAQCFDHVGYVGPIDTGRRNSEFIAAANPKAITALLDELDRADESYALLFAENARLRAELEPSMFWNWDDAETNHGSIDELLSDEYNNGCLEVGARFRIQRAAKLPDSYIEVTAIDDESGDATYIESDKAMGAK